MMIVVMPEAAPDNASLLDELGDKMLTKIRQKHWKERNNLLLPISGDRPFDGNWQ